MGPFLGFHVSFRECRVEGAGPDLAQHAQLTEPRVFEQGRIVRICIVTMRCGSPVHWNVCMQIEKRSAKWSSTESLYSGPLFS